MIVISKAIRFQAEDLCGSVVMGAVSGIVMAFQFGANWSVMSVKAGSVLGPLLGYETFTAFMLEATFLTNTMCIAAAGAGDILRNRNLPEARIMLR
jgi:cytochrome bd-type quinol oxidase subunit 1